MAMSHHSWTPDPEPSSVQSSSSYDISIIHHSYTLNPSPWPVHPLHAIDTAMASPPPSPHPALHWALSTASALPSFPLSLLTTYALHRAAELNRPDLASLLLTAYGADPTSLRGLTLRDFGTHALIAALLRAHLSPNALIPAFHSVHPQRLIRWVLPHHTAIVLLLSQGAEAVLAPSLTDPGADDNDLVLLDYAAVEASLNTFKLLQRHGAALGPRTLNLAVLEAARLGAKPAAAQRPSPSGTAMSAQMRMVGILRHLVLDDADTRQLLNTSDASVMPGVSTAAGPGSASDDSLRIHTRRLGTPLMYAVSQPLGSDVFLFLLRNGADPRVPIVPGCTTTVFIEAQRLRNGACWRHLYNWETTCVLRADGVRWARPQGYEADGRRLARKEGHESGVLVKGHGHTMSEHVLRVPVQMSTGRESAAGNSHDYSHSHSHGQDHSESYNQSCSWSDWDSPAPSYLPAQAPPSTMLYPEHYGQLVQDLSPSTPSSPAFTPTTPLIVRSSDKVFGPDAMFIAPASASVRADASSKTAGESPCVRMDSDAASEHGHVQIVQLCRAQTPPETAPFPGDSGLSRDGEVFISTEDRENAGEDSLCLQQAEASEPDSAEDMEKNQDASTGYASHERSRLPEIEPRVTSRDIADMEWILVRSKSAPSLSFYQDPFEGDEYCSEEDGTLHEVVRASLAVDQDAQNVEKAAEDDEDKENKTPTDIEYTSPESTHRSSEDTEYTSYEGTGYTSSEDTQYTSLVEESLDFCRAENDLVEAGPLQMGAEDPQDECHQLWRDLDDPAMLLHASGCLF